MQTAVEWFYEQIEQYVLTHGNLPFNVLSKFKKQAKEIEHQQLKRCADFWHGSEIAKPIFEKYLNEQLLEEIPKANTTTAVEWLQGLYVNRPNYEEFILEEEFEMAKQMQKQQTIDFAKQSIDTFWQLQFPRQIVERYYDKKFKK